MGKFQADCERVAEQAGVNVTFYVEPREKPCAHEDDGFLHIRKRGLRAAFDVANDEPKCQNAKTREILTALGMEHAIGEETLAEETDDDDGCCSHCGR